MTDPDIRCGTCRFFAQWKDHPSVCIFITVEVGPDDGADCDAWEML